MSRISLIYLRIQATTLRNSHDLAVVCRYALCLDSMAATHALLLRSCIPCFYVSDNANHGVPSLKAIKKMSARS